MSCYTLPGKEFRASWQHRYGPRSHQKKLYSPVASEHLLCSQPPLLEVATKRQAEDSSRVGWSGVGRTAAKRKGQGVGRQAGQ